MKGYLPWALALSVCLTIGSTSSADVIKGFTEHYYTESGSGLTLPFRLLRPPGYDADLDREYPLILYMHGSGSSGTNNTSQLGSAINNLIASAVLEEPHSNNIGICWMDLSKKIYNH